MKQLVIMTFVALTCLVFLGCSKKPDQFSGTIVDLSYAFDSTTVYWPTEKSFVLEKGREGVTPEGYFYMANSFQAPEHGGTHIDAPIHFFKDGETLDELGLEKLIGPGLVVDVSDKCAADRDYQIQVADFEAWEKKHGARVDSHIVLLRTGFGRYYPDRVKYMGTDERGEAAVTKLHFPGLHPNAAAWLMKERNIKAIGIDTPSIDYGQSTLFESHVTLFRHHVPAIENAANLDKLPESGFTVIALPMKIKGASGGPVRLIAVLNL